MKALIGDQLCNHITEGNFDNGYLQSNTVIGFGSKEDLAKIWATLITLILVTWRDEDNLPSTKKIECIRSSIS